VSAYVDPSNDRYLQQSIAVLIAVPIASLNANIQDDVFSQ
jgi:hypothetical protein